MKNNIRFTALVLTTTALLASMNSTLAAIKCELGAKEVWKTGFVLRGLSVTNTGDTAVRDWQAQLRFQEAVSINKNWGARIEGAQRRFTVTAFNSKRVLAPGERVQFGFTADGPYSKVKCVGVNSPPEPGVAPEPLAASNIVWKHCADEGQLCAFSGTWPVRYGANGKWETKEVSGRVDCSNAAFGDPIFGTAKTCQVPKRVALRPDVTPTPNPNATARWSDPATWGGRVPAAGAAVTIPENKTVLLDTNIRVSNLIIDGNLRCANKDLAISARKIMVHGRMVCGTNSVPFTKKLTITMVGAKPASEGVQPNKVIMVMNGGKLYLHGEERRSWLNIEETANAGSRQLVLEDTTEWRAGDRLIVTATSANYQQTEEVVIKRINGKVVELTAPLKYRHFGEKQVFRNDKRSWTVNTRAEVGLLSRNIQIVGDAQSNADRYGAHMMVMRTGEAYIAGIEMDRGGQYGVLARYPFHWHMAGDVDGQYIKNSAIHNSFNRCITVHGSHNARVEDNVCYNHVGHGYFLEDGIEQGNVFDGNLGVWTIRPPAKDALIKSDFTVGPASQGPATYWISNANNTFTNNVAAGSDGLGFWYDTDKRVTGSSANLPEAKGYSPELSKFGKFKGNKAHSSRMALSICGQSSGRAGYLGVENSGALIEDFTVYYGGKGAVWPCAKWHRFNNMKILDTGVGSSGSGQAAFVSAYSAFIDNSLFVSNSALSGNRPASRAAFGLYDFGTRITNSHFVNYSSEFADSPLFTEVGGAITFMHQGMRNITTEKSNLLLQMRNLEKTTTSGNVVRDYSGDLSGRKGRWSMVPRSPLMTDGRCKASRSNKDDGMFCPYYYGMLRIGVGIQNLPEVTVSRTDKTGIKRAYKPNAKREFYKAFIPFNQSSYHVIFDFRDAVSKSLARVNKLKLDMQFGTDNDTSMIALRNIPRSARIAKSGWVQVNSLPALRQYKGRAWFKEGSTVHVKFLTEGNNRDFQATDSVEMLF